MPPQRDGPEIRWQAEGRIQSLFIGDIFVATVSREENRGDYWGNWTWRAEIANPKASKDFDEWDDARMWCERMAGREPLAQVRGAIAKGGGT